MIETLLPYLTASGGTAILALALWAGARTPRGQHRFANRRPASYRGHHAIGARA